MAYYLMRPCRTAVGFVATLRRPARLDLAACRQQLAAAGVDTEDLHVMLVVRRPPECTLYYTGKVLVKTDDEAAARHAVEDLYAALGLARLPQTA